MAIDQKTSLIDTEHEDAGAVIENEIPTYRAISGRAVFCLVCGVLSVFSFAHPVFYAFSILAVGLGIWAHRTIRRLPDMLTGQGLASTGIGLGHSLRWRRLDDHDGAVLRAHPAGPAVRGQVRQGSRIGRH